MRILIGNLGFAVDGHLGNAVMASLLSKIIEEQEFKMPDFMPECRFDVHLGSIGMAIYISDGKEGDMDDFLAKLSPAESEIYREFRGSIAMFMAKLQESEGIYYMFKGLVQGVRESMDIIINDNVCHFLNPIKELK